MFRSATKAALALLALPALTYCGSPADVDVADALGVRQINSRNDNLHVWMYADNAGVCFYRSNDGHTVQGWPKSSPTHLGYDRLRDVLEAQGRRLERSLRDRRGQDELRDARKFNEAVDWIVIELTREDSNVKVDQKTEEVFDHLNTVVSNAASQGLFSNNPCRNITTRGEILTKLKSGVRGDSTLESKVQDFKLAKVDLDEQPWPRPDPRPQPWPRPEPDPQPWPRPEPRHPRSDLEGRCRDVPRHEWTQVKFFATSPFYLNYSEQAAVRFADRYFETHACGTFPTFQDRFAKLKQYAGSVFYMNLPEREAVEFALEKAEYLSSATISTWTMTFTSAKSFFSSPFCLNESESSAKARAHNWVEADCGGSTTISQLQTRYLTDYSHAVSPFGRNMRPSEARRWAIDRLRPSLSSRCAAILP